MLDGKEISESVCKDLLNKYAKTYIVMECFMGGMAIETPDGMLQAEVSPI